MLLVIVALSLLLVVSVIAQIVGIVASFKKKWYIGLTAILVPGFALVVGTARFFKKDLLS